MDADEEAKKRAFLQAIIEAPDDDTPRLIYADWLEEHGGDPDRAEFIRTQIALAKIKCGSDRFWALKSREKELLAKRRKEWAEADTHLLSEEERQGLRLEWLTFSRGVADVLLIFAEERQTVRNLHAALLADPANAVGDVVDTLAYSSRHMRPWEEEQQRDDRLALRTLLAAGAPVCDIKGRHTTDNVFHAICGLTPAGEFARRARLDMLIDIFEDADRKVWKAKGPRSPFQTQ